MTNEAAELPPSNEGPGIGPVSDAGAMRLLHLGGEIFATGRDTLAASWQPPTVAELQAALPQYEIAEFLGRGGMGAVFSGTQRALERQVAIKVLPPMLDDSEGRFAQRFQKEAQAIARLNHPNIVTVYEAGETAEGLLYFVMERIDGTDVARLIASEGRLDAERAVRITVAVCEALAFAHEEGIVHRDIKPSNVMIDRKGRVKVADFGLARQIGESADGHAGAGGTPIFTAPEALSGSSPVDGRADIYAVGVMLYQMLTGALPGGTLAAPSQAAPASAAFDAVVARAMHAQPSQRYSTARELQHAVERAAGGSQRVQSVARALVGTPRRRWLLLAGGTLAGGALLGRSGWWARKQPGLPYLPEHFPLGKWTPVPWRSLRNLEHDGEWHRTRDDVILSPRGAYGIDWGIRAEFRGELRRSQVPTLIVRENAIFNYSLYATAEGSVAQVYRYGKKAATRAERYHTLTSYKLIPEKPPGTPYRLEVVVIGRRLLAHVPGRVVNLALPDEPARGSVALYRPDADWFRHLEVIRLDGLSEAEAMRAAGFGDQVSVTPTPFRPLKIPGPAPGAQPASTTEKPNDA